MSLPFHHFFFSSSFGISNKDLKAAPIPSKENINKNHGDVPKNASKYLPIITPINIEAAMTTPICKNWAKARIVLLFLSCFSWESFLLTTTSTLHSRLNYKYKTALK